VALGGDNSQEYPDCLELVRHLGTSPDAKCNDYGDVVEVSTIPAWEY